MTLVLDIEHLLGVGFAARDQASGDPDWPPQPDRVFSALVASWGARGECDDERRALEWLETQPAPEIATSDGFPRTAPIVFVPPNDDEGGRVGNAALLPALRRRQARRFPAFRPTDPVVSLIWRAAEPDPDTLGRLNALAADTAYVGHSASLTRCRFRTADAGKIGEAARRGVYRGRLAELHQAFHARPLRRPAPGAPVRVPPNAASRGGTTVFAERWLVLEHIGGEMPDLRAAAVIARQLRDALMSGYRQIGAGDAIPAELSGHQADGKPASQPHLAIAPLAFVGWRHASAAVHGFALIPPRDGALLENPRFRDAVRALLEPADEGRRVIKVRTRLGELSFAIGSSGQHRSLDPARYTASATVWASCTPIVLDRHLKATGNAAREQEVADILQRACINARLPELVRVAAGKHSAIEGAPSAYPSGAAPRWSRWTMPESLASRQLTHAVLEFKTKVRGPVILGAGRFVGLGLCLPLHPERRP